MPIGEIFNTVFFKPILNLLVIFYKLFNILHIPGDFGFAIIALTVLIRFVLHPFFKQQLETSKKMQDIKPHLDRLSKKHKNDKVKLQQEQMKLYQQAGINPASGCLFMIIQIPVFIALYNTLQKFLLNQGPKAIAEINKMLYMSSLQIKTINPWFFGFNLALSPAKSGQWYYYAIPLITAFLQYLQTKVTMPSNPAPKIEENKENSLVKAKDNKENSSDFQSAMNTQMKFIFPLMIGWFSYTLPVGLSLYWNIFSLFSIMQYRRLKTKN